MKKSIPNIISTLVLSTLLSGTARGNELLCQPPVLDNFVEGVPAGPSLYEHDFEYLQGVANGKINQVDDPIRNGVKSVIALTGDFENGVKYDILAQALWGLGKTNSKDVLSYLQTFPHMNRESQQELIDKSMEFLARVFDHEVTGDNIAELQGYAKFMGMDYNSYLTHLSEFKKASQDSEVVEWAIRFLVNAPTVPEQKALTKAILVRQPRDGILGMNRREAMVTRKGTAQVTNAVVQAAPKIIPDGYVPVKFKTGLFSTDTAVLPKSLADFYQDLTANGTDNNYRFDKRYNRRRAYTQLLATEFAVNPESNIGEAEVMILMKMGDVWNQRFGFTYVALTNIAHPPSAAAYKRFSKYFKGWMEINSIFAKKFPEQYDFNGPIKVTK